MYTCNCGKQFETQRSLNSHARFCDKYVKKEKSSKSKSKSKYKLSNNLYKCECGKEFDNHQSLNGHFGHCLVHRNGEPGNKHVKKGKMTGWDKFSEEEIKKIKKKSGNTISKRMKSGKIINGFKGKHHTKETKEKMSKANSGRNNGYVKTNYYKVFCLYENKDIKVQGTWELKYANYLNENNILWTRSKHVNLKYKLFKDDYWHTYYPDFYLIDNNEYVEIKGYWWKSKDGRVDDKRKMKMVKKYNPTKKIKIIENM
jgi:hypothetical protein